MAVFRGKSEIFRVPKFGQKRQKNTFFFHTNQFSILVHPEVTTKDNLCIYQNFLSVQLSDTVILPRTLKFLLFKVKILCVQTIEILLLMCFPIFIHVLSFDFQTQPTASFPACGLVLSGSSLLQSMERNASEIYFGQNVDISLLKWEPVFRLEIWKL